MSDWQFILHERTQDLDLCYMEGKIKIEDIFLLLSNLMTKKGLQFENSEIFPRFCCLRFLVKIRWYSTIFFNSTQMTKSWGPNLKKSRVYVFKGRGPSEGPTLRPATPCVRPCHLVLSFFSFIFVFTFIVVYLIVFALHAISVIV